MQEYNVIYTLKNNIQSFSKIKGTNDPSGILELIYEQGLIIELCYGEVIHIEVYSNNVHFGRFLKDSKWSDWINLDFSLDKIFCSKEKK